MARTVIEEQGTTSGYVEDRTGPAVGLMVGLVLAVLVLVVAFLVMRNNDEPATGDNGTSTNPGTSQSTEPTSEPSTEPSAGTSVAP